MDGACVRVCHTLCQLPKGLTGIFIRLSACFLLPICTVCCPCWGKPVTTPRSAKAGNVSPCSSISLVPFPLRIMRFTGCYWRECVSFLYNFSYKNKKLNTQAQTAHTPWTTYKGRKIFRLRAVTSYPCFWDEILI